MADNGNKMSAERKLTKARISLVMTQPFFGSLSMRMETVEQDDAWFASKKLPPTTATDGKTINYSAKFIEQLSVPEVVGLLCQAALHVGMLHHTRRGKRDNERWQKATDYAANQIIRDSKISLPDGALYDKKFEAMAAEEIYNHVKSDSPQSGQGKGKSGGADFCSVMDADGDTNIAAEEASWKTAMASALHQAKMAGKVPAGLDRFIKDLLEPKVDWGSQLRQYLTDKMRADDDWSRPNRRFAHRGLILPSIREEPTGELVVAVDTSGSISDAVLSAFQSEIRTIASEVQPEKITVIYCDAAINRIQIFERDDTINLKMCGGGGTDFNPPFRWVEKEGIKPHAFVYLTDGYGPFPPKTPEYPVVWCMISDVNAPFGEHVFIDVNDI